MAWNIQQAANTRGFSELYTRQPKFLKKKIVVNTSVEAQNKAAQRDPCTTRQTNVTLLGANIAICILVLRQNLYLNHALHLVLSSAECSC